MFLNSRKKLGIFFVGGFSLLAGLILIVTATVGGAPARAGDLPSEPSPIYAELIYSFNSYNNSYTVTGVNNRSEATHIIVPTHYNNGINGSFPVTVLQSQNRDTSGAFQNCINLQSVVFQQPSNITTFGGSLFRDCPKLTSIDIPESVTYISGAGAFWAGAFSGCTSLEEIILNRPAGSGMITLDNIGAFEKTNLKIIHVPSQEYKTATNWSQYAHLMQVKSHTIALPPQSGTGWVLVS